jgi:cellobiose phosphorylase
MQYGHFDDQNKEYVITNPATPWPWINYLGTRDFFSLVSNTAGGYSFFRDAKFRRLTRYRYNGVPMDAGGRYFYIKEDGEPAWNPGWKPTKTELDSYECRHGLGYTVITGVRNGLKAQLRMFVPLGAPAELLSLKLTNTTDEVKHISIFSFLEWCLWNASTDMENFQRNFSTGEVEVEGSTIYHKTEYKERRNHYAFFNVNSDIVGFDTDRESFLGLYNGFDEPQVVSEGKSHDSVAHGWSPVASHHIRVTLAPGESCSLEFMLGYVELPDEEKWESKGIVNKKPARELMSQFASSEQVDREFDHLCDYWSAILSNFNMEGGPVELERMVNIWNQYQCMVTFCFSRSASFFESGIGRGMGFRDSCQDLAGFVHQIPGRARERILDIAATQRRDGSCYHQYQPLTKRGNNDIGSGFNDDPMWLVFAVSTYIKETGDLSILDELVTYDNNDNDKASLLDHMTASVRYVTSHLGPHGLPLIGRADWNDCLNLNCFSNDPNESFQTTENKTEGSKAESLMIAGQFVMLAREYARMCRIKGHDAEADFAEAEADKMAVAVENHGWDGEWYLRAYDFDGRPVGSNENKEGKIFIESQGWCGMAGIGKDKGLVKKAMESVKKHLDTPYGIVLNWPAFTEYVLEYGEISTYPKGYKENAGIFTHNNPWIMVAEALYGDPERAWDYYTKIAPAFIERGDQKLRKVEPYVYCQMTSGRDAAVEGEGKNSWLTGTAAWNWLAISQYLLGIRPDYDGLIVDPKLPAKVGEFKVTRKWRGATYEIVAKPGVQKELRLNGEALKGNKVPQQQEGTTVKVEVTY